MSSHHGNSHKHRHRKPRLRVKIKPGTRPGSVQSPADAPRPRIHAIGYSTTDIDESDITDVKQIPPLLAKWPVVWINVDGLGDAKTIRQIGDLFGLHDLVLEDVVNVFQRAKVEPFDDYVYVVVRMPNGGHDHPTEQISLFFGSNFVLTFQEHVGDPFDPIRTALRNPDSRMRKGCAADYLAYRIIDTLVDSYFPLLEQFGDELDRLDDAITRSLDQEVFNGIHRVKSELVLLRRAAWPLREAIHQLSQETTTPLISDTTRVFWRDCYDHAIQVIDLVESYREICADLRDFYLSSVSNRMNEIMKVLTVIATIFIPLGFIAGLYGMNFHPEASPWNMPELSWRWGYPFAIGMMGFVAVGMLVFFWRRGWIGRRRK